MLFSLLLFQSYRASSRAFLNCLGVLEAQSKVSDVLGNGLSCLLVNVLCLTCGSGP